MNRVAVLGTYDAEASSLFDVDLMRYLTAYGTPPSTIVFRTGGAVRHNIPLNTIHAIDAQRSVVQISDFNDPAAADALRRLEADLFVYAGGRDLLREQVLGAARLGCLGGHYGPLPSIRGMGTVEWSVLNDQPIVVAIQRMSGGVDTGDIVMQAPVALRPDDTFTSIRNRCYFWTKVMLAIAARALLNGSITPTPQRLEDGTQYYRLHPDLTALATRKLAERLRAHRGYPWSRPGQIRYR
jgi:methionyl-tRNA formyltransferase